MTTRKSMLTLALLAALANLHAAEVAPADPADAAASAAPNETLDTISVVGQGETRQVQRVSQGDSTVLPPGASPLKVLDKLPGVHFESADPFGNYEWSTRISLRGFNQYRLGFTLDGIPLGDMSYGNNNGLHISRALIAENLGGTELAEGIGALGTASTSNLGGAVQFISADPLRQYGVRVAQTIGSDSARRTFARLDTGDHNGFAMYLSAVDADTDKWKGYGDQKQSQFNGKAVYDFGGNHISALVTTSHRDEVDYADLSLESQRKLGWDWDNYAPDWNRSVAAANGQFSGGVAGVSDPLDAAYYLGRGLRDDKLFSLNGDFNLAEGLVLHATAYHHENRGQGHWFTPYAPSSPTVPISIRTTEYGINRTGAIASLTYETGIHHFEGGVWYENSDHTLQRNYYGITGPVDDSHFLHAPTKRAFYQQFNTVTRQFYAQDTMHFLDGALTVDVGFKSPHTDLDATSRIGSRASGSLTAEKNVLPQVGVGYKLTEHQELFASYAENMAAFQAGVSGPFSASQAAFDVFGKTLKPERSKTFEGGVRSFGDGYEASLALYTVKFDNRLLAISQCAGIVGCPTAFANVGSASSRGVEATFVWKPMDHLRWFNTVSYNRSRYDSDYVDGQNIVPTRGKTVVDAPHALVSSEIAWQEGPWDLRLGGKYTGKRYITYVNDSSVPGFLLFNASAGYDLGKLGMLEDVRLQLNLSNLTDKRYFATVGSNGFVVSDPQGQNYTLLTGAPRQVFFTVDARF
ncbi:TonB-dependent receptor [Dokdonella soli]|uniref:TonB-dependent receptor n=1 Tax=Dokdonella soli TaxID=529810 RepID=A0ABN1IZT1_9GAMM